MRTASSVDSTTSGFIAQSFGDEVGSLGAAAEQEKASHWGLTWKAVLSLVPYSLSVCLSDDLSLPPAPTTETRCPTAP